jgi:hypothetical protein
VTVEHFIAFATTETKNLTQYTREIVYGSGSAYADLCKPDKKIDKTKGK